MQQTEEELGVKSGLLADLEGRVGSLTNVAEDNASLEVWTNLGDRLIV